MHKPFRCPQGHHWEVTLGGEVALDLMSCPVCGGTAETVPPQAASEVVSDGHESLSAATTLSQSCPMDVQEWAALVGYDLLGELGRGGMGVVYRARQRGLGRLVALKMIRAAGLVDGEPLLRFRAEAEAVARLRHPNIVQIYEIGELAGRPYFSLELAEGGSLDAKLAGTPQPARQAAALVEPLARAVHHAHEHGIVHRDLKPSNVLLTADGVPKLTDFGLARSLAEPGAAARTHSGAVVGTPSYMAPEQAEGRPRATGPASDVYALGAILYEALTGRPPFRGPTVLDTLEQVRSQEPVPPRHLQPGVPRDLETITLKCLQKDPGRRYASAAALADDLRRFLEDRPIVARPVGVVGRGWRWCRRNRAVAGLLAAVAVTLLAGTATASYYAVRATAEKDEADAQRKLAEKNLEAGRLLVHKHFVLVSEAKFGTASDTLQFRRELLGHALDYFKRFRDQNRAHRGMRADVADSYFRVALITDTVGSKSEALAEYEEARALYEQLVTETPDDRKLLDRLARTCNNLAIVQGALGRYADAVASQRRALALRRQLVGSNPDPATRNEVARDILNLATLQSRLGQFGNARRSHEQALELQQRLVQEHPEPAEYRRTLGSIYNNQGVLLMERFDLTAEALRSHEAALALRKELLRTQPVAVESQDELAATYNNLGVLHLEKTRRYAEARAAFEEALPLREKLVRHNPAVTRYHVNLADTHTNLGILCAVTERPLEALYQHQQAQAVRERLATKHPDVVAYQRAWAASHHNLGKLLGDMGKPGEALQAHQQALAIRQKLVRQYPNDVQLQRDAAASADLIRELQRRPPG
jgi:serine/threonine-protein kinase